jgi:hypothetical protein
MKLLFCLFTIVFFMSCVTQKRCLQKFPPQIITKDSTVIKDSTIYRDTTITIPGDSTTIHDSLPCPDVKYHKVAKSKSGRTTATVDINNGKLTVNCKTDSLQQKIDSLKTHIRSMERYRSEVKLVPVPKYKTPAWCWWLVGANVLFIVWRIRKPILSIVKT